MASRKHKKQKQNAIIFFTKSYENVKRIGNVFKKKATDSHKASKSIKVAEPTQPDLATPNQDGILMIATSPHIKTSKQQNPDCWLLQLPAELRNAIWELTCIPSTNKNGEIELLRTALPSASLLFSCRQIHHEAVAIYHQARTDMFEKGRFRLDATRYTITASTIKMISRDLQKIKHLHLTTRRGRGSESRVLDGVWEGVMWHRKDLTRRPPMQWFTVLYDPYRGKPTHGVFQTRAAALVLHAATTAASLEEQILFLVDVDRRASP